MDFIGIKMFNCNTAQLALNKSQHLKKDFSGHFYGRLCPNGQCVISQRESYAVLRLIDFETTEDHDAQTTTSDHCYPHLQ